MLYSLYDIQSFYYLSEYCIEAIQMRRTARLSIHFLQRCRNYDFALRTF